MPDGRGLSSLSCGLKSRKTSASHVHSLTNVSLHSQCDNSEQEVGMIKMLRMVRF